MNRLPLTSHLSSEKWNSDKRSIMAISEKTKGTWFGLTWEHKKLNYSTFTHIKLYFFPPEISLAFSKATYDPLRKRAFQSGLWSPSVACAGTHHPWQENTAQGILSCSTMSHSPGAVQHLCPWHTPPSSLALTWCPQGKQSSQPDRAGAHQSSLAPSE